ncbi:MAG: diguanylate cyclase [Clostridia bacterium]
MIDSINELRKKIDKVNNDFAANKGKSDSILSENIEKLKQNLALAKKIDYKTGIIEAHRVLGIYYCYVGDSKNAYVHIKRAEDLFNNSNKSSKYLMKIYNVYVVYYGEVKKEYTEAIEYCNKALKLAKDNKDSDMIRILTTNLGFLFYEIGLYGESLDFLYEALDYSEVTKSKIGKLYCYSNLANCYYLMGNEEDAKEYFLKTIELSKKVDDVITFASASSGLAKLSYKEKDVKKAYDYLEAARKILNKNDQKGWELNISLDLLEMYLEQKDIDKIGTILPRLEQIANEIENNSFYARLYDASATYYSLNGKFEIAYENSKKALEYQKRIMEKEEYSKVKEMKDNILYQQYKQLEILSEIGQQITSINNLQKIFKSVNESLSRIYNEFNFAIGIIDGENVKYDYFNFKGRLLDPFVVSLENQNSFGNYVIKNDRPILISNIQQEHDQYIEKFQFYGSGSADEISPSLMVAPLKIQEEILGVIQIQSYYEAVFSVEDIKILEIIASYTAIAINNSLQARKLRDLATKDALTGLYNWRYYSETLKEKVNICQIDNCSLTLTMVDIDHFKKINDEYGHEAGNKCLMEVANRIKEVYKDEVVCRIGGEEFAVLAHDSDIDGLIFKAKKIVSDLSNRPLEVNGYKINMTISTGQVSYSGNVPDNVDTIFRQADDALYKAKENGRNQAVVEIV